MAVNLSVAQILFLLGKINSNIYKNIADGTWGTFDVMIKYADAGLKACLEEMDTEGMLIWMFLLQAILTEEYIFEIGVGEKTA